MAATPEPAEDENDASFLDYLTRNALQCKTLTEFIQAEVAKAVKAAPNDPPSDPKPSGTYLERQNQMLIDRLLKLEKSTPVEQPPTNGPTEPPKEPPKDPKAKPEPTKAFWR